MEGGWSHCIRECSRHWKGGRRPSAFSGHAFNIDAGGLMKGGRRRLGGVGREGYNGIADDWSRGCWNELACCDARDDLKR